MNEEFNENTVLSVEDNGSDWGFPDTVSYVARDVISTVSAGDAGSFQSDLDGSDCDECSEILSNAFNNSVSGGDCYSFDPVVYQEIYTEIVTLNTYVRDLSALVSLVLAFLLLDWTGRKLLTVVKRFSGKR